MPREKTEKIYRNGQYVGCIRDRGGFGYSSSTRYAFCVPNGGTLFARATKEEIRAELWQWL